MTMGCQRESVQRPQSETTHGVAVSAQALQRPVAQMRLLQQALGNQGVLGRLQAKLAINQPGDVYEQEADRVAQAVMASSNSESRAGLPAAHGKAAAVVQRKCAQCEEEEKRRVQRMESSPAQVADIPPIVGQVLNSPGRPLDFATRAFFEPRFGYDFSGVRVHADRKAGESARAVKALAYTVGHHVVFDGGRYEPAQNEGRKLLAHELAHVIQQSGTPTRERPPVLSAVNGLSDRRVVPAPVPNAARSSRTAEKCVVDSPHATAAPAGILQRQGVTPLGPGGGFGGLMERDWRSRMAPFVVPSAPSAMPPIPVGSPHAALPKPLLETLWRSYARRLAKTPGSDKNLDNAFWAGAPKDFWEALDRLAHDGMLPIIQEIYTRWVSSKIYWGHLAELRDGWGGTSRGFNFNSVSTTGLSDQLRHSNQYCEDAWWLGGLYHFYQGETPCWRETVSCAPGLHFCLGKFPPSVHIDPTQVVHEREADGSCDYDMGCVYGHFKDLRWVP